MDLAGAKIAGTKLRVRLNVTSEVANNWKGGQGSNLEPSAREQAERAAKVRYMGRSSVQVELLDAQELWLCEMGQSKIYIDFIYEVTVR